MNHSKFHFWIIISIVAISGFSQGMLLPLIAVIFEHSGVSSSLNGFHATAIYIGTLLAAPFMEKPLRKMGYKPLIAFGTMLVIISLTLFPVWQSFWFWFLLRLFVGIGDHILHFGTQTWITASSPNHKRGRNIAIYGFFFSFGFALGPVMTRLVEINKFLPFWLASAISFVAWCLLLTIRNEFPEEEPKEDAKADSSFVRFRKAWKIAWVALLPPLSYGFLEASLNGNFPVYALRIGISVDQLSLLLPAFAIGSLITQMPLGVLSDLLGRQRLLKSIMFGGFITFLTASLVETSFWGLLICLTAAGMLVGSTFSLGLSYMTDLLPKQLLPAGNLLCGICYSVGSIIGPFIGGIYIQLFPNGSFFYVLGTMLLFIFIPLAFFKQKEKEYIHASSA